jgi:hypothetical protein
VGAGDLEQLFVELERRLFVLVVVVRRRRWLRRGRWLRRRRRLRRLIQLLDAFAQDGRGAFVLERRGPTIEGSVAVRAAQACVPFLEGNAFGLQLSTRHPIVIERRLGRSAKITSLEGAQLSTLHAAALPRLVAHGHVGERWARGFEKSPLHESRGILRLFTGLLVRAPEGSWLRISATANRRSVAYEIDEVFVAPEDGLVPLVLSIRPRLDGPLRLDGEIATLALVQPGLAIEEKDLEGDRAIGEAHASFYDPAYFSTKKGDTTRKYKRLVAHATKDAEDAASRVVRAGPVSYAIETRDACLTRDHLAPVARSPGVRVIGFDSLLAFDVAWDGMSVTIDFDREALARHARSLERTWTGVYGARFMEEHRGALLYLTKYFTPHPHGEAHFFVKPWAFVATPPGISSLVEGMHGEGWDVLRGVVATDMFHAAPAVFLLRRAGERVRVREGQRLVDVIPFPRALDTKVRTVEWSS